MLGAIALVRHFHEASSSGITQAQENSPQSHSAEILFGWMRELRGPGRAGALRVNQEK